MAPWIPFPHAGDYRWDAASVTKHWSRLHCGDAEPCPQDAAVLQAWVLFHNGEFEPAAAAGLNAGGAGITVANKATVIYANYLEPKEKTRLDLFMQVAERAAAQAAQEPENANAWYWQAYALGRYSQGISVAKALAQGLGGKFRNALEKAMTLSPQHADAHIAMGTFHAEVIDKVGALIGAMTYGAKKEQGLQHFQEALRIHPDSAAGMIEYANALVMLEGDRKTQQATQLYEKAAASKPLDAKERLDVEMARLELQEG
jgi:tetratricopeptide (TPR) repeat protein